MDYTKEDFDKIVELLMPRKGRELKIKHDRDYTTAIVDDKEYDAEQLAIIQSSNYLDDEPTYLKRVYLCKDDDGEYFVKFDFKWMMYVGASVRKMDDKGCSVKNILRMEEKKATYSKFLKNIIAVLEGKDKLPVE